MADLALVALAWFFAAWFVIAALRFFSFLSTESEYAV
jgi:hypothetical protein